MKLSEVFNSQTLAAGRNLASYVAGGFTVLGIISIQESQKTAEAIGQIADGITTIATGMGTLITIFTPLAMAWYAKRSASPASQVASVAAMTPQTPETKQAVLIAAAKIPEVEKVVTAQTVAGEVLAQAVPSAKVDTK